ncbi:ATP--cobalamin adenosyltransferase [mine drainage metagenome]|uniref:ATP--cobalamin adenosyltransferase n=1 Tax=mine drainage metagenome TaxID=410659 RepID=T1BF93_9ZZZZ
MAKFYTGLGDSGDTTIGNAKLSKNSELMYAIGDVDELNSSVGLALMHIKDKGVKETLDVIQNHLFIMGAEMISYVNTAFKPKRNIDEGDVKFVEDKIEEYSKIVPDMKAFVLPRGVEGAEFLHSSRAITRRAERSVVQARSKGFNIDNEIIKYLNRLSSLLFVLALYVNKQAGFEERNPSY